MSFRRSLRFAQHFLECAECGENAEYHCRNCFKDLCQVCRGIHTENVATRSHIVTLYTEKYDKSRSVEVLNSCSIHEGHEIEMVCEQCNMPVCSKCKVEAHKDHFLSQMTNIDHPSKKQFQKRHLQNCFNYRVPNFGNFLQHISIQITNKIWIANGEGIVCVDNDGKILDSVEGTFSDWGCHMVDSSGNLLFVDASDNSIKEYKQSKEIKTLITSLISAPLCIYSCPRTKNIIVALKEGEIDIIIRYDKEGKELAKMTNKSGFDTYIRYITENINGDICMSCFGNLFGSVVGMTNSGDCRFSYFRGRAGGRGFMPLGICTDSNGLILVINASEHNIHVIDQNGWFLSAISTGEKGLYYTCGLCIDDDGYLWTCGERGVAKWEYEEDDDVDRTDRKKKCSVS